MEKRNLPESLIGRLSEEELAVLKSLESSKNSKVETLMERKPEPEGLSDLDEYDMECEVLADGAPVQEEKKENQEQNPEVPAEERALFSEMASLLDGEEGGEELAGG